MPTYTFEPIKWPASKRLPCPGCGKKIRRSTTFSQTLNPFNKNADGQIKTRTEIYAELQAKALEWQQIPETCTPCSQDGADRA